MIGHLIERTVDFSDAQTTPGYDHVPDGASDPRTDPRVISDVVTPLTHVAGALDDLLGPLVQITADFLHASEDRFGFWRILDRAAHGWFL